MGQNNQDYLRALGHREHDFCPRTQYCKICGASAESAILESVQCLPEGVTNVIAISHLRSAAVTAAKCDPNAVPC